MKLARRTFARSLLTSTVVVGIVGTLAACGGDDDTPEAEPDQSDELSGKVVVWDQLYGSQEPWKAVVDDAAAEFEELHPGVDIEIVAQPADVVQFSQLFQSAVQAQSGPDVSMMLPSWSETLTFHEALLPLDEFIDDEFRSQLSGWDGAQYEGVTYGIPFAVSGQVIAYNKELFTQAGLDPENPPTSMDELVAAAEALSAAGIQPFSGGNKEGYLGDWAFAMIWPGVSESGDTEALNVGDIGFTDETVKAGISEWLRLVDGGYYNDDMPSITLAPDGVQPFEAGEAAMTFTIYTSIPTHADAVGADNMGIISVLDATKDAEVIPAGPAGTWTVPKFSKNQAAAVEYAKYLTSASVTQRLFDATGYLPNHVDADFGESTAAYPAMADLVDVLRNSGLATETPVHGSWDSTTLITFGNELALVVLGEKSLDDALAEVERVAAERRSQLTQ